MAGEGKIEGINYGWFRNNGGVIIVEGSVDLVIARESVGRSEFSARKDLPDNVKVLEEKRPSGLSTGEFAGVFEVGQVLVIGDDSDRMGRALNVLSPFSEGKDDCKEFSIVDVVVSFGGEESAREVGTGVKVSVCVALE